MIRCERRPFLERRIRFQPGEQLLQPVDVVQTIGERFDWSADVGQLPFTHQILCAGDSAVQLYPDCGSLWTPLARPLAIQNFLKSNLTR
jgi:hypothetical protein